MKNIDVLAGRIDIDQRPFPIFDDSVCEFLDALSKAMLASKDATVFPDLALLAFWLRRAQQKKLKEEFGNKDGFLGRGVCFHISPANVPVNFAFSWVFSLLAGNCNIVRAPGRNFPQVEIFCKICGLLMMDFPEIQSRNVIIRYPRDNNVTAGYSALADARMVWGGDATICMLRSMPVKPRCVDLYFSDRYSIALIDAKAVEEADDAEILRLAENFYNDAFLMDQNACSSPRIILWQGGEKGKGRERFWQAVTEFAGKKYEAPEIALLNRFTQYCNEAIDNPYFTVLHAESAVLSRLEISRLRREIMDFRGNCGYFHEYFLNDWSEFYEFADKKIQTVSCFGVDREKLRGRLVQNGVKGVDRIINMGNALKIGANWDGFDVIRQLARRITLE